MLRVSYYGQIMKALGLICVACWVLACSALLQTNLAQDVISSAGSACCDEQ